MKTKKNLKLFLTLILSLSLMFSFTLFLASCGNKEDLLPNISLTTEKTIIDKYEQLKVTAVTENLTEAINWTTSNNSVATVDSNGLVSALTAGDVKITASANSVSASIDLKVENSESVPVLVLDYEALEIGVDTSVIVTAIVKFKNTEQKVESIIWESSDEEVFTVTKSSNTSKATVKGIKFGRETLQVKTSHLGLALEKTIEIVVKQDVSIRVDNLVPTEEGYTLELFNRVAGYEEQFLSTFKLDVKVRVGKEYFSGAELSVKDGENENVVTIGQDYNIVASNIGDTILEITYIDLESDIFKTEEVLISVIRPTIALENTYEIETSRAFLDISDNFGEITDVYLSDISILKSNNDGIIALKNELLPKAASELGKNFKIKIKTDSAFYIVNADIYTLIIRTKEDLNSIGTVSKQAINQPNLWDGYFILGNDIDFNDETFNSVISYDSLEKVAQGSGWLDGWSNGFKGIFDGKGYNIEGLKIAKPASGMFGVLHKDGVIKNVSFTNAINAGWSGFICSAGNGTIENVYIHFQTSETHGNEWNNSSIAFGMDAMGMARLNKVFVDVTNVTVVGPFNPFGGHAGYGTFNGAYSVGSDQPVKIFSDLGAGGD